MADIQRIQCEIHQKTSSYRRNSVPYMEIGIMESNGDVRTLTNREVHKWAFLRMPSENVAKNCPKCRQIAKIFVVITS